MTVTQPAPCIPHYVPPAVTTENLDYADLAVIDLSKFSTPEGRAELVELVREAMRTLGFLCVINHGLSREQKDRVFDIGNAVFAQVPDDEKRKYANKTAETGTYQGYKLRESWYIDGGVRDQIEHYNTNRDVFNKDHPEALRPLLPEINAFAQHNHYNVLHPILRLMALGLELPEDALVKIHSWHAVSETSVRFMKYYPRSAEDEIKANNVWLKGHTDIGSITILWSQPISALQIQSSDGKWKWVKHIDNALVINAGDCMEFLSGGRYKATIHRVVQPPVDQQGYERVGAFYFAFPDENVKLVPFAESPVLQRVGITRRFADAEAPTVTAWRKGRTAAYGITQLKKSEEKPGIEEEYINGILVEHYN
ncbi:hypothetical protein PHLGIDRAFT_122142 [Phlebiopsis gigantea 11061_1 CR5-6]|uniref:Fe2OG dioxygenase domain-containing protein n=1 Tax=Phlebiopsis gigantea (strain 11061_1 CR5-6) TaxID=745531 RepID=A0A0C3RRP5_PHLG1|nr:hypothetical protein PHLGIDRAFT_122142 [Phlebiopsis gigantea 11061_1 CR5-6]